MVKIFVLINWIQLEESFMKNNKKLVVMLAVILIVLIGIAVALFMKGNSSKDEVKEKVESQESTEGEDVISTVEQQIKDEEAYCIETEYVNLYYPKKWKDNIETEILNEEGYVVEFYGKVEGKDRQKLFEVVFNGDASMMAGTIEGEEGNTYVGFNFAEPEMGDDWTDEEVNTIYAMQEDLNYLIGMLEKEDGYKTD